ncbi:hypothetical protein EX30DRAFT_312535 [Ascodesmis nigricans]|uniref:G-protein coupled receptors family 2 profile 2 domain-containing protein n=1 Tax=Ascodesmis nigricans TaxID=341454 RepID=A0A4V3SHI5_9PEZI|nr:hypothetical protein EX30DRAFT_312535 [Ascodesmis nigricans]
MIQDNWTPRQLDILQTTSRVSSAFSLAGALFIIITFCTNRAFHRPINRLAFFASFGNIATNAGTIISRRAILEGTTSTLCQSQAMIIQWMIPADVLFCLAMALNVYLTVFKKKTTVQLRKLEPYYIVFCYLVPLIPSIVFLVYRPHGKIPIYGDATLWCWIAPEWNILRVASFYGPVWVILFITFLIYVMAGRVIFNLRSKLRFFHKNHHLHHPHHPRNRNRNCSSYLSRKFSLTSNNLPDPEPAQPPPPPPQPDDEPVDRFPDAPPGCIAINTTIDNVVQTVTTPKPALLDGHGNHRPDSRALNNDGMYTCMVTTMHTYQQQTPSQVAAAMARQKNTSEANTAAWAYCRCAMLFFLALVITWLPSSINRVYQLKNPTKSDFNLNLAAALVLPAQGFWNGLIYIVTTLPACRRYFAHIGDWVGETKDRATELVMRPFHRHSPEQHRGTGHHGHRNNHAWTNAYGGGGGGTRQKEFSFTSPYRSSGYTEADENEVWAPPGNDLESAGSAASGRKRERERERYKGGRLSPHLTDEEKFALQPSANQSEREMARGSMESLGTGESAHSGVREERRYL